MRVYLAIPQGIAMCGGKRIHGYAEKYDPVTLLWKDYRGNKDAFVEVPFTPEYLSQKFERPCNLGFRFTLSELRHLDYNLLKKIASFLEINGKLPKENMLKQIHNQLRDK